MNFIQHASAHGLMIRDVIADGRWHRVPTIDHPRKKNGAYVFDGNTGACQNWATMQDVAVYRPNGVEKVSRQEYRLLAKKSAQIDKERQQRARQEAASIIQGCKRDLHPYLVAKGFPSAQGLIAENGDLIIPMRDFQNYSTVNGLQRIFADGTKLFLPGTKAKGSVFIFGKTGLHERWLVEGYATALSVRAALIELRRQAEIIVCFSAGNLIHVAEMVKRPAFVMADNDASKTGEKAAQVTGLPWVMPNQVGMDANDLHRINGLRALVNLIRSASQK